jgi:hypothetical protein
MIIPLTGGPPVHKLYPGMNNLKSALMGAWEVETVSPVSILLCYEVQAPLHRSENGGLTHTHNLFRIPLYSMNTADTPHLDAVT